ncbi:MAG: PKD domain-containing protein [Pseudomonadota bacterium]
MKKILSLFLLALGVGQAVQAQTANDIQVTHCTSDCGQVLVGAARVEPGSIQWTGAQVVDSFFLESADTAFAFTGASNYLTDAFAFNTWTINPPSFAGMSQAQASGSAPAFGIYFAPQQAGAVTATQSYRVSDQGGQVNVSQTPVVQGTGVADSDTSPAITLDVTLTGTSSQAACADIGAQCTDAMLNTQGVATFSITPRVNAGLVPAGAAAVQYVLVELQAEEVNTSCTGNDLSFTDSGITANSFTTNDYYHYLEGNGPNQTPASCTRNYAFLVSVDKTFLFQAANRRSTAGGRVEYNFFVRGHQDTQNRARWPGSQPLFRLSTDTVVSPPPTQTPPVASFSTAASGLTVMLNASASSDADGTIASYVWQSSDGTTIPAGQNSQVTFPQAGTYTITLTVTDNDNLTGNSAMQVTVSDGGGGQQTPPTAMFTTTTEGLTATLNAAASSDADGNIASYQWQSNDGTTIPDGQVAQVTFAQAGTFNITLTVTDNDGLSNTATQMVTVSATPDNTPPTAAFTFQSNELVVTLDASGSSDADGSIVSYEWQSNAGVTIANGQMSQATYPQAGTFTITLTVTDNNGETDTISQAVTVSDVPNVLPIAAFTFQVNGLNVALDASGSSDMDGNIASYQWQSNAGVSIADGLMSQATYPQSGTFTITLTVIDNSGGTNSVSQAIVISSGNGGTGPTAAFTFQVDGLNVMLDASSSTDTDGSIVNYQWQSNGGVTIPNGQMSQLTYPQEGTFTITLTVTDNSGLSSMLSQSITLVDTGQQGMATADFTATPIMGEAPLTVMLDAQASQPSMNATNITSYQWISSNGSFIPPESTQQVIFGIPGTYTITLTVTDNLGIKDTAVQTLVE